MTSIRAKLKIDSIEKFESSERLNLSAVSGRYSSSDDSTDEDNTYARWTPQASFQILINNPDLHDQYRVGDKFEVILNKVQS